MLVLYYAPNTCALASHIALEDAGAEYRLRRIDFDKEEQRGPDYWRSIRRGVSQLLWPRAVF